MHIKKTVAAQCMQRGDRMAFILSIGTSLPEYDVNQERATEFARYMFQHSFKDIDRLLTSFKTGKFTRDNLSSRLNGIKRITASKKKIKYT